MIRDSTNFRSFYVPNRILLNKHEGLNTSEIKYYMAVKTNFN